MVLMNWSNFFRLSAEEKRTSLSTMAIKSSLVGSSLSIQVSVSGLSDLMYVRGRAVGFGPPETGDLKQ